MTVALGCGILDQLTREEQIVNIIRTLPFYKGVTRELTSPTQTSNRLIYTEGTVVTADGIDLNPDNGCGQGVNFCRSIADALRWGPVVVEIRIPDA